MSASRAASIPRDGASCQSIIILALLGVGGGRDGGRGVGGGFSVVPLGVVVILK